MSFDGVEFGREIVEAVRRYVARETDPLREQIAALQRQVAALAAKVEAQRDP